MYFFLCGKKSSLSGIVGENIKAYTFTAVLKEYNYLFGS
jgi:hypothetical protein